MSLSSFGQTMYHGGWFLKSLFGIKNPLVNTMIIHYGCNLDCEHCGIRDNLEWIPEPHSMSWELAVREMQEHYDRGIRILFFEGGEPTIWKDGDKDLGDLISKGREIGYYVIGYTSNGTGRLFTDSDVISVSLDGPREIHDAIRAPGVFDRMMGNVSVSGHPNVFANMTITRTNVDHIEETLEIVRDSPIRGIMMNFITPPPGELVLSHEDKVNVVERLIDLKSRGYPVLNSKAALKELLIEDYGDRCPIWVSEFVLPDGSHCNGCPMRGEESCARCGFDAVREYRLITRGNLGTILSMAGRFATTTKG